MFEGGLTKSPPFFLKYILYISNMETIYDQKLKLHIEESKYQYEQKIEELTKQVEQLKNQIR